MWKETIICTIIIVAILMGNYITQNYTIKSIEELTKELGKLRSEINVDQESKNVNYEKTRGKMEDIFNKWTKRHDKLAYYIEHDELEKVETNLTGIKSYIETKEYSEAINELDKCVFILNHIEDKYMFNLQNIF